MIRTWRGKTLTFEPLLPAVESIAHVGNWVLKAFVKVHVTESGWRHLRVTNLLPGSKVTMSFEEDGVFGIGRLQLVLGTT